MKLTYKAQLILSVVIVLLADVTSTILKHWIYHSIGFVVCGLLWFAHPVLLDGAEVSKRTIHWTRIAGIILIFIGIFTRVYLY